MRKAFKYGLGLLAILSTVFVYTVVKKAAEAATHSQQLQLVPPPAAPATSDKFPERLLPVAKQAIFMVKPYTEDREQIRAGGTGFLLEPRPGAQPLIVTNRHVCEMPTRDKFVLLHQEQSVYAARILQVSDRADLCIIIAPRELIEERRALKLADVGPVKGDHVAVFGHPFMRPLTISQGRYTNTTNEPFGADWTFDPKKSIAMSRVDFMVFPGNSGSPVFNEQGQVIGVIFAMEGPDRVGLFVPLQDVKQFLLTGE